MNWVQVQYFPLLVSCGCIPNVFGRVARILAIFSLDCEVDTDGLEVITRTVFLLTCGLEVVVFAVALGFDLAKCCL